MNREEKKIVFMGSPEFAVPTLSKLYECGYDIVGVITAPDKASGRGLKVRQSAVKKFAEDKGLNILQPKNLKNEDFQKDLTALGADVFVVVAFRMLPKSVWSIPPKGTINLHASLLPDYRGAAPLNWVLINGEKKTGITTFFIEKQIDTGKIILQQEVDIEANDTAGDLHDKLMGLGGDLILETVDSIFLESYTQLDQDISLYKNKAPKIFKEDCKIDWDQDAEEVHNFIRGLSPSPGSWTTLEGKILKIYRATIYKDPFILEAGEIYSDNKSLLLIGCKSGCLEIKELQLEGKKRLAVNEFLKGFHFDSQSTLV